MHKHTAHPHLQFTPYHSTPTCTPAPSSIPVLAEPNQTDPFYPIKKPIGGAEKEQPAALTLSLFSLSLLLLLFLSYCLSFINFFTLFTFFFSFLRSLFLLSCLSLYFFVRLSVTLSTFLISLFFFLPFLVLTSSHSFLKYFYLSLNSSFRTL